MRRGDDPFLMMFTSGTTGPAKGVMVPLKALLSIYVYMRYALDLRAEDAYWNIADPGWAYGLYFAVIGPLLLGHATTLYDGAFTAESTYRVIEKYGITNLAGAPTAFRLLIAAGVEAAARDQGQAARRKQRRRDAQSGSDSVVSGAPGLPDQRPLRPDRDRHGRLQPPRPQPPDPPGFGGIARARLPSGGR